jgi:uncharacterized protein (TIGR03437 family)
MPSHLSLVVTLSLSCAIAEAAALVAVPTPPQPALPIIGLEANQGQATAGILFLIPGISSSMAVTAQSVLYSPIGATLSLVAGNSNPSLSFSDPLPGVVNSYTGSNPQKWVTGIPRYSTATLTAVYPGINAQYTVNSNGILALNLMLAAGVNPTAITFQIAQASQIVLNPDGSLLASIGTSGDVLVRPPSLSYPAPMAFQSTASGQVNRSVSFAVQSATTFGLTVQGLDATEPLQISIQVGGSGPNPGFAFVGGSNLSATDPAGNTYFATTVADPAGKTAPFPTIGGVGCGNNIDQPFPCLDVAVYKFSAAGVLDYITYLAGRTMDSPGFLGLAPGGALVVAGTTDSSDFPITAAAAQPAYAGPPASPGAGSGVVSGDYFAAMLDPGTGALESSTYLGGPSADTMQGAAIGVDGSLYFLPTGVASAQMPVSSGALQSSCPGSPCLNGYVAHLSPALDKLLYGTYVPGTPQTAAQLYSDGSVYYAGTAQAGFPTTPGPYQPQNAGGYDGIIARLDPTGSHLVFGTYYGTANTDWTLAMTLAPDGSVWADVYSFVQCCVSGQYQLIHLSANGEKLLANVPLNTSAIVVNPAGDVFALASGNITVTPGALLAGPCGVNGANPGTAAYVELSPTGQQLFATYLPVGIGSFDGADAQGTPYLDTVNNVNVVTGRVQVVESQSSGPFAGCVVDAADFGNQQVVSPGAIVTIFGSQMGPGTGVSYQLENGQVPTTLGGTQVLVNGAPVPILYSSSDQLNLIVPYSLVAGTTPTIQVVSNNTPANAMSASVIAQGISIFQENGSAAALNQDGTLNSAQNPAQPGSIVQLFGTGGGQTNPPSVAGEVTPLVLRPLVQTPTFMIGYVATLNVVWAGAAPGLLSGVTQVNVQLPDVIPVVQGYPQGVLPLQVDSSVVTIFAVS